MSRAAIAARAWPVVLAVLVLWGAVAWIVRSSLADHPARFVYALDDSYIHMAMARHWAEHGVWGITPYEWSSTSSSLLWSLLLAGAFRLLGTHDLIPLVSNLLVATALLCIADALLARSPPPSLPPRWRSPCRAALLLFLILAAPLPTLVVIGMEHTLQALLDLLFVCASIRMLSGGEARPQGLREVLLLAPLVTLVRYEGLFLVVAVAVLCLLERRFRSAFAVVLCGVLPVATYALVSVGNGWYALPNPILLKGGLAFTTARQALGVFSGARVVDFVLHGASTTYRVFLALAFLVGAIAIVHAARRRDLREQATIGALILAGATWWQVQFAGLGALGRYEAYLVVLAWWVLCLVLRSSFEVVRARGFPRSGAARLRAAALTAVVLLIVAAFGIRGTRVTLRTVPATGDIYRQHYHLALFLKKYYEGAAIAANDIGAINYYVELRCLDLMGLGSLEPARHLRARTYDADAIEEITEARGVVLAIVYDSWFTVGDKRILPEKWVRVGQWSFGGRTVAGGKVVSFYVVRPDHAPLLAERLRDFEKTRAVKTQRPALL